MFNMEKVGKNIAEMRKNQNMTQLELADKMGISFQAVSNWERGTSMPDISKLPELAEVFGVTIDEILGEKSELVENIINDNVEIHLGNNDESMEELSQIAPLLKPEQINLIFKNVKTENIKEIEDFIPFIGCEVINELAIKAAEEGNASALEIVAPFASQNVIDTIANKSVEDGSAIICNITPFISKNLINELALDLYQKVGLSGLDKIDIIPFISKDRLIQIAEKEYEARGFRDFDIMAPFLPRKYLNDFAQKEIEKNGIKAISNIAPFISKEVLAKYVKDNYL